MNRLICLEPRGPGPSGHEPGAIKGQCPGGGSLGAQGMPWEGMLGSPRDPMGGEFGDAKLT